MSQRGESERRPALPPDSDATILTCRACVVDVSVARGAIPRCPRCGGPLDRPLDPDGDAPERTLLEVRVDPPSGPAPLVDDARAAARAELRALANTATQVDAIDDDGTVPGVPPSLARMGVVREPAPEPVRRLGQYELRRVLGKGGMGIVYEAWQPSLGRAVALKVMSAEDATEEELERFDREARAAAKLQHKNIVPIYDVGSVDGRAYFTMDLVRGRTLQELARSGSLRPEDAARMVASVARAIHYAHEKGIIHRDLKPSNVLVDEHGEPHVTDFGLAKDLTDQSIGLTLTGVAMGSPPYMPPEQAKGEFRRVDAVSDVYGLGAILYECLTGSPPFTGKSVYDIIAKVLVEEPAPPRRKNPAVPVDLETICLKALEKEKWRRYPTAEAMAQDLERLLAGRTIEAVRHGFTTRIGRGIERHRWQIVSILVPLTVAVGIIGYLVGGRPQPPGPDTTPPPVMGDRGAIANVAADVRRAIEHLDPLDGPTWREVAVSLEHLPEHLPARSALARDVEGRVRVDPDGRVPPQLIAPLIAALVGDRSLDTRDIVATVAAWYGGDGPLAEVAAGAVLAHRGGLLLDPDAYRMALEGPRTPIDVGIVSDAARSLAPLFQREREDPRAAAEAAVAAVTSDPVLRRAALRMDALRRDVTGTVVLGHGWVFPPVTWPGAPEVAGPARPLARGLLGRGASGAPPTEPLLAGDGATVYVGWLRFLYVLDEDTGRVLRRVRLPGAARALAWDPTGAPLVRVWDGARERQVRVLLPPDLAGPAELRWVDDGRERPVQALDLLPVDDTPAADELRRVACAFFPALDDRLEVFEEYLREGPDGVRRETRVARILRLQGCPQLGVTLALSPSPDVALAVLSPALRDDPREPIAARVVEVAPGSPAAQKLYADQRFVLEPGDVIISADAVSPTLFELRVRAHPNDPIYIKPTWAPLDWDRVSREAAALVAADDDPNPWLQAFAAAGARHRPTDPDPAAATAFARAAVRSEHLTPWERVELACFLDRWGFEDEADHGLSRALADLLRAHAYAPDLAGYGARDPGRAIADRVVAHREARRHERAAALARWRDAFAPVLRESSAARQVMARHGAPPADPGPEPDKGVAGLTAIDILRLDHAIRLQVVLITTVFALLIVLLVRYRRHAIRDLARLQVNGPVARWAMWVQRPWTRLTYTWPTYITLSDKLAFIALYVVYFMALAVQDAGFDVLAALRRGHEPMLSGVPAQALALRRFGRDVGREEPDADRAYALLWGLLARGDLDPASALAVIGPSEDLSTIDDAALLIARCEAALAARGRGRDHLLLAEVRLARGRSTSAADSMDAAAKDDDPEVAAAAALLGGDASPAAVEALAAASPRHRAAIDFTGGPARPLSPPPTPDERDLLVVGRTRWWSAVPGYLLRNLTQPVPGTVDASLVAFEEAWSLNLQFARMRNDLFFLVPTSVFVLVILLLVRTPRWFELLASDITPSRGVSLLRLLVPGVAQVAHGRSVRGVLLVAPFAYVAQTLWNARHGVMLYNWLQEFAHVDASEIAALTAEAAPAISAVRVAHTLELVGVLGVIYVIHWIDLAMAQRKLARAAGELPRPKPVIVPVDSEVDLSGSGPFDRTEPARP